MEEPCNGQRSACPCNVWAKQLVDLGYNLFADVWLQTNLVDSSVGALERSLSVADQFQVFNGHSNFINNLVSNSNSSHYGMPIDSADTSAAMSSWYLYDSDILSFTLFRV